MNLVDGCDQLTMFQLLFVLLAIRTISAIEDEWSPVQLIPVDYDRTKAPPVGASGPLNISLSVSIIQLMGINEAEQSMTIDIMYHQRWTDRRLFFPRHNHEVISLDMSLRAKLWMPDVYVINSLSPGVVQLVPLYMELESNTSQLVITSRQTVKLRCPMDLFNFPQDTQKCDIELSLMTTPSSKASLVWESFGLNPKRWFPNFHVINSKVADCESVRGPSYSCIKGQIKLFRNVSYYMIRIYGPSFLMVITSFVGFWVPPCGYPGRIALALTPLLTLVTQENQVNSEVNVSYVVALHIWMIFSLFFVFMTLIEYAAVMVYCHVVDDKKTYQSRDPIGFSFTQSPTRLSHWIKSVLYKVYGHVDFAKNPLDRNKVDYVCRIVFPITYLIFIIVYMCIFLFPWLASRYDLY